MAMGYVCNSMPLQLVVTRFHQNSNGAKFKFKIMLKEQLHVVPYKCYV